MSSLVSPYFQPKKKESQKEKSRQKKEKESQEKESNQKKEKENQKKESNQKESYQKESQKKESHQKEEKIKKKINVSSKMYDQIKDVHLRKQIFNWTVALLYVFDCRIFFL